MKNRIMKLAQALSLLALVGFGSSAHATQVIITFDEADGSEAGGNYTVDGWTFTNVNLNSGNCEDGDCINFTTQNGDITLSHVSGFVFTLDQFWVNFQSLNGGVNLAMTGTEFPSNDDLIALVKDDTDPRLVVNGVDYDLGAGKLLTFFRLGTGNLRLDTFHLTCVSDDCPPPCTEDCQTVPEPGTLALLGLGLLGLSVSRRRKI